LEDKNGVDENAHSVTVLLVEDNDLNRDMLSRRLKRREYKVLTATDGESAIQMSRDLKPDLILMDMGLPGINGWDATRTIKADPFTSDIPVIALTAHALLLDREQALAAGCDAFETKPVDLDRLVATMARVLNCRPQRTNEAGTGSR
jgi:two-component system cell cycle response regulator DivK